ncbi:MAG: tetratricopeptide repeat protein [Archangium sp.]|nr:tetratricopeptide repeat protein [Archangium sp.]
MRRLALVTALVLAACRKDDAPAHLERARTAQFQQKPDVAIAEYKLALDLIERDSSPQANLYRARALRGAADLYAFQLNDPRRAIEVYRELITVCPEAPETLEGRLHLAGLLWHQFRDLRGAIAEYTSALARNPPQSAELSFTVAKLYFELQDYEQCELEAGKVSQKFETSAWVDDALYLRGQALAMMDGRKPEAQRVFLDLLDRFPDSELRSHALVELGRLKADAGEPEQAIELWVSALKTHPTPAAVQQQISLVRGRLRATTPRTVGDATAAFDWDKYPVYERHEDAQQPATPKVVPRTSAEAVGGTPEEAELEAKMPVENALPPKDPPGAAPQ